MYQGIEGNAQLIVYPMYNMCTTKVSKIYDQYYSKTRRDDSQVYFITSQYWARDAPVVIKQKIKGKQAYDKNLQEAFEE